MWCSQDLPFKNYWNDIKRWSVRNFYNDITLMVILMPIWKSVLDTINGYGHFTLNGNDKTCIDVSLTIFGDYPLGLRERVSNLFSQNDVCLNGYSIKWMSLDKMEEPYHAEMLKNKTKNQEYQLFLTALSNENNWETYKYFVSPQTVKMQLSRYISTNCHQMLKDALDKNISMTQWTDVFTPFFHIGLNKSAIKMLIDDFMEDSKQNQHYYILHKIVDLAETDMMHPHSE